MINAINPTTSIMPHTMPALKMPSTTEQLPRQKAKKKASKKIIDLIPFFFIQSSYDYQIAYLFLLHKKNDQLGKTLRRIGESILQKMVNGLWQMMDFTQRREVQIQKSQSAFASR